MNNLKSKIIKANPSILEWRCNNCNKEHSEYHNGCVTCSTDELFDSKVVKKARPIQLADVLIWLGEYNLNPEKRTIYFRNYYPHSLQFEEDGKLRAVWNLAENYDGQSKETKNFLEKLN